MKKKTIINVVFIFIIGIFIGFSLHSIHDLILLERHSSSEVAEPTGIPDKDIKEVREIYLMPEGAMIEVDGVLVPYVSGYTEEELREWKEILNNVKE